MFMLYVSPTQTLPYRTGRLPEINHKISSKTYNFLQDQEISWLWLNKFTLFSCPLLITFASSLDPGQHRQNASSDMDSTGPDLDPKHLTPWLWWFSWKKNRKGYFWKKISADGDKCMKNYRYRGWEFVLGVVPYFRGDLILKLFLRPFSSLPLIQEGFSGTLSIKTNKRKYVQTLCTGKMQMGLW